MACSRWFWTGSATSHMVLDEVLDEIQVEGLARQAVVDLIGLRRDAVSARKGRTSSTKPRLRPRQDRNRAVFCSLRSLISAGRSFGLAAHFQLHSAYQLAALCRRLKRLVQRQHFHGRPGKLVRGGADSSLEFLLEAWCLPSRVAESPPQPTPDPGSISTPSTPVSHDFNLCRLRSSQSQAFQPQKLQAPTRRPGLDPL